MDASGGNANRDALLVHRLREADKQAFTAVMQSHNRALWRVARAILKDEADAEEAVQEAYLRAFSSIRAFWHQSSLSTWLRIAINEALRLLAKGPCALSRYFGFGARRSGPPRDRTGADPGTGGGAQRDKADGGAGGGPPAPSHFALFS
jgi:hypothetical protein